MKTLAFLLLFAATVHADLWRYGNEIRTYATEQAAWCINKGMTSVTQAEADALVCGWHGGTMSNNVCVYPPPIPPKPMQAKNGIAVPIPDQAGSWYVLQPTTNGAVVALSVSGSPIGSDWQTRKETALAAYQAEADAQASAIAALNLTAGQIAAIQSYFATDVDVLFANLTANQRAFLKVQQALIRALAKREVKELR